MSAMAELDAVISHGTITNLIPGQKYKAITTGTVRGRRIFREFTFTAARASVETDFGGPAREGVPAESRVFQGVYVRELRRVDAHPVLVVSGSIEAVTA